MRKEDYWCCVDISDRRAGTLIVVAPKYRSVQIAPVSVIVAHAGREEWG